MHQQLRRRGRRRPRLAAAAACLAGLCVLAVGGGQRAFSAAAPAPACAAATLATIAAVDAASSHDIYANELAGTEVSYDLAQITGASDLLAAVAADNAAATLRAVSRIVFHPAWHIVRLRVLDSRGRILADVGGPYVIAPVSGVLRDRGRIVGSFVMSVQDDVGYTKLVTRFIGDPVGVYLAGKLVAERYAALPPTPPGATTLTLGGVHYQVISETDTAFPAGTLTAVILVATPPASLETQSCAAVRAGEFGRIGERFARLAIDLPDHYPGFATTVHIYTGAEVFVRDGAKQLGSSSGAGPRTLPNAGTISYDGSSWLIYSFEPSPPARVYMLIPPA